MATLYIVGFAKKKLASAVKMDTGSESIAKSLGYGGKASLYLFGDHGCVMDSHFAVIMTWDGNGYHYTSLFKNKYKG